MADKADDRKKIDIKAEIEKIKRTLAAKLPGATKTALDLGMASSILLSVGVITQQSPDQVAALVTLLSQLGLNWLAQIVLDMRSQTGKWRDEEVRKTVKAYEPTVELQLTDTRLHEFVQQLDLATTWMTSLNGDAQRREWLENAAKSGVFAPEQLQTAANEVNLHIAGSVYDSVILAAGRDISNVTITVNSSRLDMRPFIELYKNELQSRLAPLALGGVVSGASRQILELAQVYTPLTTWREIVSNSDSGDQKFPRRVEVYTQDDTNERILISGRASIIAVLNDVPRAVILGGAGSGKSTVLNYLGLGLCNAVHGDEFSSDWTHRGMLPIVVTLRRFGRYAREVLRKDASLRSDPGLMLLNYVRDHKQEGLRRVSPELADHLNEVLWQHGAVWLLDGLDEVHTSYRRLVNEAIQALVRRYPRCRYVVTCRSYSYREDWQKLQLDASPPFAELPVQPFDEQQIGTFVMRWYDEVSRKRNKPDAQERARRLVNAIERKRYLRRIAANPLLLSLMADLHSSDNRELPEDRWVLLREALDLLMYRWQANKNDAANDPPEDVEKEERIRTEIERQGNDRLFEALSRLAFDVHCEGDLSDEESTADIPESKLMAAIKGMLKDFDLDNHDLADYLCERVGLVVDDGGEPRVYRFPHRIFQEYLAAYAMRNKPGEVMKLLDSDYGRWREVYALIALMKSDETGTASCVNRICKAGIVPQTKADWRRVLVAGDIWMDRRVSEETKADVEEVRASIDHVRACLRRMMSLPDAALAAAPERAAAADLLARLGIGDLHLEATTLDAIPLCFVPRGPFILGSDKAKDDLAYDQELWGKPQDVAHDFYISQYPITNAQYAAFVAAQGYAHERYWDDANEAEAWRSGRIYRKLYFYDDKRDVYYGPRNDSGAIAPYDFGEPFNLPNHPVIGVCWYEALAFTLWLTERWRDRLPAGWVVTLPSETEWEKAARGGLRIPARAVITRIGALGGDERFDWVDNPNLARRYAYNDAPGDDKPDAERMNYDQTRINATSAVGCFPKGVSPYGCEDMNGNAWEWTLTSWRDSYQNYREFASGQSRTLRGGAYSDRDRAARCACRTFNRQINGDHFGFRVVVRAAQT